MAKDSRRPARLEVPKADIILWQLAEANKRPSGEQASDAVPDRSPNSTRRVPDWRSHKSIDRLSLPPVASHRPSGEKASFGTVRDGLRPCTRRVARSQVNRAIRLAGGKGLAVGRESHVDQARSELRWTRLART